MLKKIWHDPVWSKVIAGVALAALAVIGAYFLDWWPAMTQWLGAGVRLLGRSSSVPNWLLGLLVLLALPAVVVGATLLAARRGDDWRSYTTDNFYGLRWRWHYIGDGIPDRLATFCPNCDFQVFAQDASSFRSVPRIAYHCDGCDSQLATFDEPDVSLHHKVERLIQQKLRNDTWRAGRQGLT